MSDSKVYQPQIRALLGTANITSIDPEAVEVPSHIHSYGSEEGSYLISPFLWFRGGLVFNFSLPGSLISTIKKTRLITCTPRQWALEDAEDKWIPGLLVVRQVAVVKALATRHEGADMRCRRNSDTSSYNGLFFGVFSIDIQYITQLTIYSHNMYTSAVGTGGRRGQVDPGTQVRVLRR